MKLKNHLLLLLCQLKLVYMKGLKVVFQNLFLYIVILKMRRKKMKNLILQIPPVLTPAQLKEVLQIRSQNPSATVDLSPGERPRWEWVTAKRAYVSDCWGMSAQPCPSVQCFWSLRSYKNTTYVCSQLNTTVVHLFLPVVLFHLGVPFPRSINLQEVRTLLLNSSGLMCVYSFSGSWPGYS